MLIMSSRVSAFQNLGAGLLQITTCGEVAYDNCKYSREEIKRREKSYSKSKEEGQLWEEEKHDLVEKCDLVF